MRGKKAQKNPVSPDPKYGSVLLGTFINYIMLDGKKTVAQGIVYEAFDKIAEKTKKDPMKVFELAVQTVSPQVEVRSKRVGGANYQVPLPVRGGRQNALTFRWIIGAARAKKGQAMAVKLATVLSEAAEGLGDAIKKRDDVHRMAEANKAFAHFARFIK